MSTAPRRPDLANEPVGRLMLRLSIPTITAQLVNMLYNIVDRIYISYIPDVGTLALTGLGVCLPIILLVSAFAALCASSGAPLASIAMGQRNHEKAEGILGSCTALLLCVSAVLTVVLSCFYTPILLAFGATEDALPYAQRYIAIYSLGTVFVQLSLGLNPFITAQGFSKAGMLTVLIGAVLNTLLDPLFIFVFHMDVQGAALATVISQAVSAAFVLRFLTGRQTILHLKRRLLRLNWKLLAPCVALGLAPFIMQSTESLVSVCFNTSLRAAGCTLAVGTMTICSTLMQFALLPLQGQQRKLHQCGADGHRADGQRAARRAQRCVEAHGHKALRALHNERRKPQRHARRKQLPVQPQQTALQVQYRLPARQEAQDERRAHGL